MSNKRDERANALDSNPCGMCRASGLAICKGHGGGGGGSEEDENKDEKASKDNDHTPKYAPSTLEAKALSSYLENSEVWNSDEDFCYEFNNDLAIFKIHLDSASGFIHFKGNKLINANDGKDLNELYDKIEDELSNFSDETNAQNITLSREGNNLSINIPNPVLYDQFVTRLLNKNLIPDNNYHTDLAKTNTSSYEQQVEVNEVAETSYKSPNPFDISKGPTPSGDS